MLLLARIFARMYKSKQMFTNQRILGALLIIFIIGASIYFAFTKFKQEITISPSPSPTPAALNFLFNNTPPPAGQTSSPGTKAQAVSQPSELPLARNKRLANFPGILREDILKNKKTVINTKKGVIEFEIYPEASMAASNFMILAANGFYDNLTFHRVEKGFVIQGGDPQGDGSGNPGYTFPDEPIIREYKKGIVAMANAGPNTNGSQFFIMLSDHPEVPKQYTIFGNVISGQDVVEKIEVGDVMQKVVIQNLR